MTNAYFKSSVILSLLGHACVFFLFSFSFARLIPERNYSPIVFLGQLLPAHFSQAEGYQKVPNPAKNPWLHDSLARSIPGKEIEGQFSLPVYCIKPKAELAFNTDKADFLENKPTAVPVSLPQESVIMFHPLLPYQLQLYFKDRQSVHIELMFNIVPSGERNSILVKRKISSGNLEADLLSKRYIEHYLFIQQSRFLPNTWRTVKIDLSNN
jgi:hypothetical protein